MNESESVLGSSREAWGDPSPGPDETLPVLELRGGTKPVCALRAHAPEGEHTLRLTCPVELGCGE